jgi:hypothetical protein
MRHCLGALLLILASSCGGDRLTSRREPEPVPLPTCGDGKIDEGEMCDGSDLGGHSCQGEGFDFGTVSCDAQCQISTALCTRLCGNGRLDPGEQCDGNVGPLACPDWGYKRCTESCQVDSLRCGSTAFVAGPTLAQALGGPSALTDIVPTGPGDLITSVPDRARLETFAWDATSGFKEARKISRIDGAVPLWPIGGDLDGDGHNDLAAINTDGTADRYRYAGAAGFVTENLWNGGPAGNPCRLERWLGSTRLVANGPVALLALGCPGSTGMETWDAVFVFPGGASPASPQRIDEEGIVAAAVADVDGDGLGDLITANRLGELTVRTAPDFAVASRVMLPAPISMLAAGDLDGDGDADLVAMTSAGLRIYENLGPTGFAERRTDTGSPHALAVLDLDLDGLADIVWVEPGKVEVRRNLGAFTFAPRSIPTGPGAPLSFAIGDLDADGDPDLAITVRGTSGAESTLTYVLVNKVR